MEERSAQARMSSGMITPSPPPRRRATVLFDEAYSPFSMVAAVVFESSYGTTEADTSRLFGRLLESYYLDDLRSYERHRKNAFHSAEDPDEARTFFIELLSGVGPVRIFIQCTRRERRPDLGPIATTAVLYHELLRTVLGAVRSVDDVDLVFETNQPLNSNFDALVRSASKTVRRRREGAINVSIGHKKKPYALAVADYALSIFGRWYVAGMPLEPAKREYREWRAIRRSISMVRFMEDGTVVRRGLLVDAPLV